MGDISPPPKHRALAGVMWVVLTLGAATNAIGPMTGISEAITLPAGVVALVCVVGLIVIAVQRRRS